MFTRTPWGASRRTRRPRSIGGCARRAPGAGTPRRRWRRAPPCSTRRTPTAARSSVRCGLHATTSIPKARPTSATRLPILPRPTRPSVAPARSVPTVGCHGRRARTDRSSTTCRARPRISAQVSSPGRRQLAVPQTVMPSSAPAARSIEALRMPVVTNRRRPGSRASRAAGNAVRSRMATTISAPARADTTASSSASGSRTVSTDTSAQRRPVGVRHRDTLVVVEHHAAHDRHCAGSILSVHQQLAHDQKAGRRCRVRVRLRPRPRPRRSWSGWGRPGRRGPWSWRA